MTREEKLANHYATTLADIPIMNWLVHHTQSENYANQAEELRRQHENDRAAALYYLAAEAEENALNDLDCNKVRTFAVMAISAVSLYLKAQKFLQARKLAHRCLTTELLPLFAVEELEDLLQVIDRKECPPAIDGGIEADLD